MKTKEQKKSESKNSVEPEKQPSIETWTQGVYNLQMLEKQPTEGGISKNQNKFSTATILNAYFG